MKDFKNIRLGRQKDIVRNVISLVKILDIDVNDLSESVEADILAEYIKNPDFSLALRCVCIDNDIQTLASYSQDATWQITYEVNGIYMELDTDNEIRVFWYSLSPAELLKQSIVHFQNA